MTGIFIMGQNYEFAKDGREIYYLDEDKEHFHNYITGKVVYAGKRTFDTLPESVRKLTKEWRVYTRDAKLVSENGSRNISYFDNLTKVPKKKPFGSTETVCIGGVYLLSKLIENSMIDTLIVTKVFQEFPDADLYLPESMIQLMDNRNIVTMDFICNEPPVNAVVIEYTIPGYHCY